MPRPNKPRTLGSERALARRIELLCEQEGIKFAELARRMTEAGCPIQTSALYRLGGDNPRSIKVDELVAIANIFDLSTDDLLRPVEVIETEWAEEVAKQVTAAAQELMEAQTGVIASTIRLAAVVEQSPDLAEFVGHRFDAKAPQPPSWIAAFENQISQADLLHLAEVGSQFWSLAIEAAFRRIETET